MMHKWTSLSLVTMLVLGTVACSESPEDKIAREVKEHCEKLGEAMATPAEKADKAKYQEGMNQCIKHFTEQRMQELNKK